MIVAAAEWNVFGKAAVLLVLVGTLGCAPRFVSNPDCPESPNN
jgi:hypothetical protein